MDDNIINIVGNDFFPYSVGIEVECSMIATLYNEISRIGTPDRVDLKYFRLDNVMEVQSTINEQRFRLPSGPTQALALLQVCNFLNDNCFFNKKSGIHIHVDMTDIMKRDDVHYDVYRIDRLINKKRVLSRLHSFSYGGIYNHYDLTPRMHNIHFSSSYVHITEKRTLEYRIFSQTFDYHKLLIFIKACQSITREVKKDLLKNTLY